MENQLRALPMERRSDLSIKFADQQPVSLLLPVEEVCILLQTVRTGIKFWLERKCGSWPSCLRRLPEICCRQARSITSSKVANSTEKHHHVRAKPHFSKKKKFQALEVLDSCLFIGSENDFFPSANDPSVWTGWQIHVASDTYHVGALIFRRK